MDSILCGGIVLIVLAYLAWTGLNAIIGFADDCGCFSWAFLFLVLLALVAILCGASASPEAGSGSSSGITCAGACVSMLFVLGVLFALSSLTGRAKAP